MQQQNSVRRTNGAKAEAVDARQRWLKYRALLAVLAGSGSVLVLFEVLRLIFS